MWVGHDNANTMLCMVGIALGLDEHVKLWLNRQEILQFSIFLVFYYIDYTDHLSYYYVNYDGSLCIHQENNLNCII